MIIIVLTLSVTASMPYNVRTEYYYNLTKLKQSIPPERIKLISVNNMAGSVVSEGMLFTYKDRKASGVGIGGNFSSWKIRPMNRGRDGVWFYFLANEDFSGKIEYKFNVDGLWTEDPANYSKADDRRGAYVSIAENSEPREGKLLSYKLVTRDKVQFRIYKPDARIISLVGDFNGWNPENDLMKRGADGVWRVDKRLTSGEYRYKFIIDGEWVPDMFNPESSSDSTGDLCSLIRIN